MLVSADVLELFELTKQYRICNSGWKRRDEKLYPICKNNKIQ